MQKQSFPVGEGSKKFEDSGVTNFGGRGGGTFARAGVGVSTSLHTMKLGVSNFS